LNANGELASLADAAVNHRPGSPGVTERRTEMVINTTYGIGDTAYVIVEEGTLLSVCETCGQKVLAKNAVIPLALAMGSVKIKEIEK
jgi:hypothetical protein